jgi:hypothetical protein
MSSMLSHFKRRKKSTKMDILGGTKRLFWEGGNPKVILVNTSHT